MSIAVDNPELSGYLTPDNLTRRSTAPPDPSQRFAGLSPAETRDGYRLPVNSAFELRKLTNILGARPNGSGHRVRTCSVVSNESKTSKKAEVLQEVDGLCDGLRLGGSPKL